MSVLPHYTLEGMQLPEMAEMSDVIVVEEAELAIAAVAVIDKGPWFGLTGDYFSNLSSRWQQPFTD